jgi:Xaa-Pro aminopeptidase
MTPWSRMTRRRAGRVQAGLKKAGLDALLVTSLENIRYLTGFTGSDALLLLTRGGSFLVVDSRYTSQARGECKSTTVIESENKTKEFSGRARKLGLKRVGFEPRRLSVAQHGELKNAGTVDLVPAPEALERARMVKDADEQRLLKKAAAISSKSFLETMGSIGVGVGERNIALLLEFQIRKNGAETIPFPIIVASGKRGALPHGLASGKRVGRGEFVTIDFGAVYRGYCSDETCTVMVGKPTARQKEVYQAVKDAHDKAISTVRPGVRAEQVDSAARKIIEKAGMGKYFKHGTGHGVGLAVHEEPRIAPKQDVIAEAGMVFTIEPGVYIPGWGGVRIEDTIRVTRQGCEPLSSVPKELWCI